jgi:hypothetical protein
LASVCHVAGPISPKVGISPEFLNVPVMFCMTSARVGLTEPIAYRLDFSHVLTVRD